jgi:hypothetical protein
LDAFKILDEQGLRSAATIGPVIQPGVQLRVVAPVLTQHLCNSFSVLKPECNNAERFLGPSSGVVKDQLNHSLNLFVG